jgi:hypothetical protein
MKSTRRNLRIAIAAACLLFAVCTYATAQRVVTEDPATFLANHEPELAQANPARKFYLISYLAPAALAANQVEKARSYAEQLLTLGQEMQTVPGFGPSLLSDGTHIGNMVLGQIAFLNGDIQGAKEHLLEAGKVPGSSVLKSFGPDMLLAKELIGKGERDTVLKYFDLCATFWQNDRGRLADWKQVVKQGGEPNFGSNDGGVFRTWRFAK